MDQPKDGKELVLTTAKLNLKADGELNIGQELVDSYGTVTDKATGVIIECDIVITQWYCAGLFDIDPEYMIKIAVVS